MEVTIYKCFIASPSDTLSERQICDVVFDDINRTIGETFHFSIQALKWEKDTRPSFGDYSQGVINNQIGNDYQIFIGIMNRKFGTPTQVASSGTEEEFNVAYNRHVEKGDVEIMFYFNDEAPLKLSDVNTSELEKVNEFKSRVSSLGGLYSEYNGANDFGIKLKQHLTAYFLEKLNISMNSLADKDSAKMNLKFVLKKIFQHKFDEALQTFTTQPLIWVDPLLSVIDEISQNPDSTYDSRVKINDIIANPQSTIIKAPPQFGLTSLSRHLVKEAWEKEALWIYLDSKNTKAHTIHNAVKNEVNILGVELSDVKCIILDGWNCFESSCFKKLKNLSDAHKDTPIYVMETIDDSNFLKHTEDVELGRHFAVLYLLALPRTQIRRVVSEYNKALGIAEENTLLDKVVGDLEILNIHRTPLNCLTLLKVSEKHFDESPVNRTKMLEMVLFVLFNMDELPTYKTKPDLKDCEYVLGKFCEKLIRSNNYEFSREIFIQDLQQFCNDKLIDLEVVVVFDVLISNHILVRKDYNYIFRFTYWIFYFGAKRMHIDTEFTDYIFNTKKYIAFPEIVEFYTGIDRNRSDALKILLADIRETYAVVKSKVGLADNMNPLKNAHWRPTEEQVEKMQNEIGNSVLNSSLPESVKDKFADRNYNQIKPYDQSIQQIFEEYSLHNLMQKLKATSRALRNSDYVESDLKREVLQEILKSWEQISKVLFALAPMLATNGAATFEGAGFTLTGDFGSTYEERMNTILQSNPTNVVGIFSDDLYSSKLGPLLYDQFKNEIDDLKKHHLALLIIFERPRGWKIQIQEYIISLHKNSFYLFGVVNALRTKYRFDFVSDDVLKEIEFLIKMGYAKHEFGDKKPGLDKIRKISNSSLPNREFDN